MRYKAGILGIITAALLVLSCDEMTTQSGQSELQVEISVTGSPFVDAGDLLVGDQVQFEVTVTEDGASVPVRAARFTSTNTDVVDILNENTGEATFNSVGQSTVRVTVLDPDLGGSVNLQAAMNVRVLAYDVQLSLTSEVTGATVPADDGLVDDTVRVGAAVSLGGEARASSGVAIDSSSNRDVVDENAAEGPDVAALMGEGTATLTVTIDQPKIPGDDPLTATLDVTVKDVIVELDAKSLVDSVAFQPLSDPLATDSVLFRATVVKTGLDTVKNKTSDGAVWTSTGSGVVGMVDDSVGTFDGTGIDTVSVEFTDLDLPREPYKLPLEVHTYTTTLDLESLFTGPGALADTLVTDSVDLSVTVTATKDGSQQDGTVAFIESRDSSVVSPVDSMIARDVAVFADTGSARVLVELSDPRLPRAMLRDSIDLLISTYVLDAESVSDATPIMGDTIQYTASVWHTRPDPDTVMPDATVDFESSNETAVRLLNTTGRALARDTGSAEVIVTLTSPTLPDSTLTETFGTTTITEERFYGSPSTKSGDFQDTIVVAASEVHSFTANTEVRFPNNTSAFVDSINSATDTLWAIIGAGTNVGQLTFINLVDDMASPRDTVLSYWSFSGGGTVDDPFEPNDTFPLPDTDAVNITDKLPFEQILSMDPARTAPSDTNFFWLSVTGVDDLILDIRAETQQDGDIDFFVCNGIGNPPTSYDDGACARSKALNGSGRVEEELGEILAPGRHVFGFYCVDGCTTVPVTYRVTILEQ